MSRVDLIGYLASGLVVGTFCMRTMVPLRLMAIGSNVGFILYGHLAEIEPVLLLHLLLLPMNLWRLGQSVVPSSVREARRDGAAQHEDESGESTGTVGRVVRGSNSEACWS